MTPLSVVLSVTAARRIPAKPWTARGVLAYIRVARLLHELTGKAVYLDHLRDALCYEYSFKFCYNVPVLGPPLSRLGWSSCGGSITSVANPQSSPPHVPAQLPTECSTICAAAPMPILIPFKGITVGWSHGLF